MKNCDAQVYGIEKSHLTYFDNVDNLKLSSLLHWISGCVWDSWDTGLFIKWFKLQL